jgi:hypothetical protein
MSTQKNMLGHRLAAMAWFQALSQQEKLTADGLEKRFMPNLALSDRHSNIFYKYRNGSAFPENSKNYLRYRKGPRAPDFKEHMLSALIFDRTSLIKKSVSGIGREIP